MLSILYFIEYTVRLCVNNATANCKCKLRTFFRLLQFSNADAEILSTFWPMETLEINVQFMMFLFPKGKQKQEISPVRNSLKF